MYSFIYNLKLLKKKIENRILKNKKLIKHYEFTINDDLIDCNANFSTFINNLPLLHTFDNGRSFNAGGFDKYSLEFLYKFIKTNISNPKIIETGMGCTTICFLFTEPKKLVTICPEWQINLHNFYEKFLKQINKYELNTNAFTLIKELSEKALPKIVYENLNDNIEYDFAFIDGNHGLGAIIDYFYTMQIIKKNGYLILDDVWIYSINEIAKILKYSRHWKHVVSYKKTAYFQKITDAKSMGDWDEIEYIKKMSEENYVRKNSFEF
jgi:hypothetical protein